MYVHCNINLPYIIYIIFRKKGFPGSQPVSMDRENLSYITEQKYKVSWKADGTRYMMLIDGRNSVYFGDRDFSIFKVVGMTFPYRKDEQQHLSGTSLRHFCADILLRQMRLLLNYIKNKIVVIFYQILMGVRCKIMNDTFTMITENLRKSAVDCQVLEPRFINLTSTLTFKPNL